MKTNALTLFLTTAVSLAAEDHFARAQELYKGGPSKAPEILAELNLELRKHPENVQAHILKALTELGTNKLDDALKTLDAAEKQAEKTKTIYRYIPFRRAQCLYYKEDYAGAKKALEPYSGFFLGDKQEEAQYDQLMDAINSKLKANNQKDVEPTPK